MAVLNAGSPEGIGRLKSQVRLRCAASGRSKLILLRQLSGISRRSLQFAPSPFIMFFCLFELWSSALSVFTKEERSKPSRPYQLLMTWSGRADLAAMLQYSSRNAFSGVLSRPVRDQEVQNPTRPAASILMINMPLTQ